MAYRSIPARSVSVAIASLLSLVVLLRAQQPQTTVSGGFRQTSEYDAPHQGQKNLEVLGDSAKPLPSGGKVLLTGLRLTKYRDTGEVVLTMEAPECVFDPNSHQVESPGTLKVVTGDGRFIIEGTGFLWQDSNSSLVISNQVRSVLRSDTNAPEASNTVITSDRFFFDQLKQHADYEGNARVVNPKMNLASATLKADLPAGGQRINRIVAETGVVIDFISSTNAMAVLNATGPESKEKTHATCDKAVYTYDERTTTTNEVLELTGNPRVEQSAGWMTAERFTFDRGANKLHGEGNYHFQASPQMITGKPAGTNSAPPTATAIDSERFDLDMITRLATFRNRVRLDDPNLSLTAGTLTANLPEAGGTITNANAENKVSIDFPDKPGEEKRNHGTGDFLKYDSRIEERLTNALVELTGNAKLDRTNGWISADYIAMNRVTGIARAVGNVQSLIRAQTGKQGGTAREIPDTIIFSNVARFDTKTSQIVYDDNVRVKGFDADGSHFDLNSGTLTADVPPEGGKISRMVARDNVLFNYYKPKGEKTTGTGDQAVYTYLATPSETNELVTLTGNPKLMQLTGWMTASEAITFDPSTGRGKGLGSVHAEYQIPGKSRSQEKPALTPRL